MSITTPPSERETVEREAWARYIDSLREFQGHEYENAEPGEWLRLQRRLRELAHCGSA